jgi:hypothetical protein
MDQLQAASRLYRTFLESLEIVRSIRRCLDEVGIKARCGNMDDAAHLALHFLDRFLDGTCIDLKATARMMRDAARLKGSSCIDCQNDAIETFRRVQSGFEDIHGEIEKIHDMVTRNRILYDAVSAFERSEHQGSMVGRILQNTIGLLRNDESSKVLHTEIAEEANGLIRKMIHPELDRIP